ncbi:MAG TPA: hypothetical protein VLH39_00035, partial [Magnetospirillaceae bacterium]|nr:hypothetical protein [Magnetospirillaceae bacterium]
MEGSFEDLERLLVSDPARALSLSQACQESASRDGDKSLPAQYSAVAAYAALAVGNPDRALELARTGLSLRPPNPALRVRLLCAEGISHFQVGR